MDAERWARVQDLFHDALALPDAERDAFLHDACGDDDSLRHEVEALLAADAIEGDLFDEPTEARFSVLGDDALGLADAAASLEGRRVGPYRIVSLLDQGGMGTVYLAEREDVGLRCALKLVRGGLAAPELVDRFLLERRVLARLEHPNIARILDAGVTDDGTPWFAMELVDGEPIDRFCEARALSLDERLELFETVGEAVAFAHRNLVVHRDLKPRNILVARDGTAKLLDFGIAKLLDEAQDLSLTGTGIRLLTPEYAAPEQLEDGPITTATDVYALGLVLQTLVSGPASPKRTDDLHAIITRALAPEPERRYPSAYALIDDVRRHRRGLPVAARPDSWGYRARRFVRRHKLPVAAAAAFTLLLSGFSVSLRLQMADTARERDRAEAEAARANQVSAFLIDVFDVADPFSIDAVRADSISVRDFFIARGRRVSEFEGPPEVRLPALNVVGHMYFSLGLYDEARSLYEQALKLGSGTYPGGADDVAMTRNHLGELHRVTGNYVAAESEHREALRLARALHSEPHPASVRALNGIGESLRRAGRYEEAESLLREALAERRVVFGEGTPEVADGLNNLGLILWAKGDPAAARPLLENALAIHRERLPWAHPMTSAVLNNLGLVRRDLGDVDGAEPLLRESLEIKREILGRDHWRIANGLINLASVLLTLERPAEAETLAREALVIARATYDEVHELIGLAHQQVADALAQQGDRDGAELHLRDGFTVLEAALAPDHPRIATIRMRLARHLLEEDRSDEAAPLVRRALEIYEARGDSVRAKRARELLDRMVVVSANQTSLAGSGTP